MLINPAFDAFFVRAIKALKPYLDDLVCIGGCANALYRYHPWSTTTSLHGIGTYDLDLAVEQRVPIRNGVSLADIMEGIETEPETFGSENDPVIKYRPKDKDIAAEIEFLCDAGGAKGGRAQKQVPVSIPVQDELYAQPLRYLDVLLRNPWTIQPGTIAGLSDLRGLTLQIPNPTAYIMQKVLIQSQGRKREAMAKDFYYMFEISVLFRDAHNRLADEYQRLIHWIPAKWSKRFREHIQSSFASRHADGPVMVMQVYRDSSNSQDASSMPVSEAIVLNSVARMLNTMIGKEK